MSAREVYVKPETKRNFSSMQPNFDQLSAFETKAQRLAERQEAKETELEVEPVINVMGSTAGAGSGEFHTYRGFRTKEMARLADMEREKKLEAHQREWHESKRQAEREDEERTAKNAMKRNKKKDKKKDKLAAEKAAKAAKQSAAPGGAGAGSADADGGEGATEGRDDDEPRVEEAAGADEADEA